MQRDRRARLRRAILAEIIAGVTQHTRAREEGISERVESLEERTRRTRQIWEGCRSS